jgi:hypothetical protein
MEHRLDLEQLLLAGLPEGERQDVIKAIRETDAKKLRRIRAQYAKEQHLVEQLAADPDADENLEHFAQSITSPRSLSE